MCHSAFKIYVTILLGVPLENAECRNFEANTYAYNNRKA